MINENVEMQLPCSTGGPAALGAGQVGHSLALLDAGQLGAEFRQHWMLRGPHVSTGTVIPSVFVAAPSRMMKPHFSRYSQHHLWK